MRLVIINPEGDDYTYSFDAVIPFAYDSAEKLLIDMENMVNLYKEAYDLSHKKNQELSEWFRASSSDVDHPKKGHKKVSEEEKEARGQTTINEYMERLKEIRDLADPEKYYLVSEDGHHLSVARFVNFQNAYQKPSISVFIEPSIITVDEWFTNQPTYTT